MNKRIALVALLLGCVWALSAQTPKVSFRARGLFDSSISSYDQTKGTQLLYSIEDFRVGFKAVYGDAEVKADIGFGSKKVAIKDLLFNYYLPNSFISVGNGYEPFSMDMLVSTLDMFFNQSSSSSMAFGDGRKVGVSYNLDLPHLYFATGIYTNNDLNVASEDRSDALVSTSRIVARYSTKSGNLFHLGGAFSYRTAESDIEGIYPSRTISSEGVTSMFDEAVVLASLDDAGAESKGLIEFVAMFKKWRIQGEYFLNHQSINRSSAVYQPHGGYAQMSYLLLGEGFSYDSAYALPGRPKSKKALELVARYNYTTLNDSSVNIYGGSEQDISLGLNFYINKYFAVKLNGSYMMVDDHCSSFYSKDQFIGQARLQFTL